MGTTGTALFSDDTAHDVREDFITRLASGVDPTVATQSLVRAWTTSIHDVDDGPVFCWLWPRHSGSMDVSARRMSLPTQSRSSTVTLISEDGMALHFHVGRLFS